MRHRLSIRLASTSIAFALALTSTGAVALAGYAPPSTGSRIGGSSGAVPSPLIAHALTHGKAGSRGSIDLRTLSKQSLEPRPVGKLPLLGRKSGTTVPPTIGGPSPRVGAAFPPTIATTNADGPSAKTGFGGLSTMSGPTTAGEPPDPWVAVGPEHVVQVVNTSMRITDRQGNVAIPDVSLADFFQLPTSPATFDSDGRVIFDSLHGRWLATEVSWDCAISGGSNFGTGYVDFAVSRTSDPTGAWDSYFVGYQDFLPDFPAPGTSADKVGLASNFFTMGAPSSGGSCLDNLTFFAAHITVMDWSDLTNGGSVSLVGGNLNGFSPRFAVQVPATSNRLHLVMELNDQGVGYVSLIGSAVANTVATERTDLLTSDGIVAGFLDPPPPSQPDTPATIAQAVDSRPTDAIWQNNRLLFVATYPCTPSGDVTLRDCVRVTELHTSGLTVPTEPSLRQDFVIAENTKDNYMGGIGLSGNGTLHVGWTRSSVTPGDFPSSYSAHQAMGDALKSLSAKELLKAGTAAYVGQRWGDYVGVAQDPQVPSQVWDGNQSSAGGSGWATQITPLQPQGTTYVPITPVRVVDSRSGIGLAGKFKTSTARTWQVTGVGGIPAGAVAVTGNMTITGQTGAGYVSVTPTATNVPQSSSLNFPVGDVRANNVTVPLSSSGGLSAVYKAATGKTADLVFDVTGYFVAADTGATLHPMTPARVLDTRTSRGLAGRFVSGTPRTLVIGGTWAIPPTATAIVGNLTVTGQSAQGYLSVTRLPTATPATSTLNFPFGDTRANGLVAPLSGTGALSIVFKSSTAGATAQVILDVTGYFVPGTGGLRFVPLNPGRIMDTGTRAVLSGLHGTFAANTARQLAVDGHWGVPLTARAVAGNLTVTGQTGGGYISVTPGPPPPGPATSTLNFPLGDTRANGLVTPLNGSGGTYLVYVSVSGKRTNLILDLAGYYE